MSFELSGKLIEKSVVSKGDIKRILKLFEKAEEGKDITIAFLGGSITQGCNASVYEKCYVELVAKWFREKFSDVVVSHINAGVGATGSLIGVHRAETDVLSKEPDIVFVDAAVNDEDDNVCRVSYESEIRRLLSYKCSPAVIEVFMTKEYGDNCEEHEIKIGNRYNVPMISFRRVAKEIIEGGSLKWGTLLTDEVHPNDDGHEIIANLLINFLEKVYKEDFKRGEEIKIEDDTLSIPCVYGDDYIDGRIENNKTLKALENEGFQNFDEGFQKFQNAWKFEGKAREHGKLVFEVKAKNIILLYKKIIGDNGGKFKISIDGKEKIIDTYFKDGWGDFSVTEILQENKTIKTQKIEIEVIDEDKDREVTILGLLLS